MIEINRASLTMALTLNQAQRGVAHRYTRDLGPGVSCIIISRCQTIHLCVCNKYIQASGRPSSYVVSRERARRGISGDARWHTSTWEGS